MTWLWRSRCGQLISLLTFCAAIYFSWSISPFGEELAATLAPNLLLTVTALVSGSILFGQAFRNPKDSRTRLAWLFIAAGVSSCAASESVWLYYKAINQAAPFPSYADAVYLLVYPLMIIGIMMLPFTPFGSQQRLIFGLDLVIVILTGSMLIWYYFIAPPGIQLDPKLSKIIGMLSPIGDLFLLTCIVALIQRDVEKIGQPRLTLLASSLALFVLVLFRQYILMLDNIQMMHRLQKIAINDNLTCLYNRHFFFQSLTNEIERARRYDKQLSIILLDMGDLKTINDTLGHLSGDYALQKTAKVLRDTMRASDIIARFGGDEFIILMPETSKQGAKCAAQKIQVALAQKKDCAVFFDFQCGIS
jgi:diguanylate cyclase (GGDEF)-like protein